MGIDDIMVAEQYKCILCLLNYYLFRVVHLFTFFSFLNFFSYVSMFPLVFLENLLNKILPLCVNLFYISCFSLFVNIHFSGLFLHTIFLSVEF